MLNKTVCSVVENVFVLQFSHPHNILLYHNRAHVLYRSESPQKALSSDMKHLRLRSIFSIQQLPQVGEL